MNIDIILEEGVEAPKYATDGSAGFDLKANKVLKIYAGSTGALLDREIQYVDPASVGSSITLESHTRILFGTGIKIAIPQGYELQIRSRSGTALKQGLIVTNSPGTVDSDYRGEIGIMITNTSPIRQTMNLKEPIAQGVICPVIKAVFNQTKFLLDTRRGSGGFGSTNQPTNAA